MSKVSVIIPNYNHSKFLAQRIETVLNQTHQNFELLLLDDNSTDKSIEVLKRYENHPKVSHFIINEENSGNTFKQWKKGLSKANGDYIWLAESDDYSDLTFLEKCVNILEKYKQTGLVFTNSMKVDSNQNHMGLWHNNPPWNVSKSLTPAESRYLLLRHNYIPNASSVLFRKELVNDNLFKNYNYKLVGDWRLWYDFSSKANVYFLNEALNYFRFHTENVRTKMSNSNQSIIEIIKLRTNLFFLEKSSPFQRKTFIYTIIDYWLSSTVFSTKKASIHTHIKILSILKKLGLLYVLVASFRTIITILYKRSSL